MDGLIFYPGIMYISPILQRSGLLPIPRGNRRANKSQPRVRLIYATVSSSLSLAAATAATDPRRSRRRMKIYSKEGWEFSGRKLRARALFIERVHGRNSAQGRRGGDQVDPISTGNPVLLGSIIVKQKRDPRVG